MSQQPLLWHQHVCMQTGLAYEMGKGVVLPEAHVLVNTGDQASKCFWPSILYIYDNLPTPFISSLIAMLAGDKGGMLTTILSGRDLAFLLNSSKAAL